MKLKHTLSALLFTSVFLYGHLNTMAYANQVELTYQQPDNALVAIADAAPTPWIYTAPGGKVVLKGERPALPAIDDLATPEERLAGIRINSDNNTISQTNYMNAFTFIEIDTGKELNILGLPPSLKAIYPTWTTDGKWMAFLQLEQYEAQIWLVDLQKQRATRWSRAKANAAWGNPLRWASDNQTLYALTVPIKRGVAPQPELVPKGPHVTESRGRTAPARTYQDMLSNEHDEALFDYYFTSEIVAINAKGRTKTIGKPAVISNLRVSPDAQHLLVTSIQRPYSYTVPHSRFARNTEVWSTSGKLEYTVTQQPVADNLPIAFDAVIDTPRSISWRSDADATLVWAVAQDGGDPRVDTPVRDSVFQLAAPFTEQPQKLMDLSMRYAGFTAHSDQLALVYERFWQDRQEQIWQVAPDGSAAPKKLWQRAFDDRYADPGSPFMTRNQDKRRVLLVQDGHLLLSGDGASDEGDRPFIDRYNLNTGKSERLWQSQAPFYEVPLSVLNAEQGVYLTQREAVNSPPDIYVRTLSDTEPRALTHTEHPMPETQGLQRELIHYTREDGLPMSATLFLPPGYDAEKDGPLPTIIWAYPREYRSKAAAAQVSGSPYEFNRVSYWRPQFLALQGYAVFDNATMPIIGVGDQLPNDTFIEQLEMNSKAAINAGVDLGVTDRNRVAIGGHSYGAFMTANVLAHTNLFKAGIARSGAYNRSLTPFGFQREERTVWDDPDLYVRMSPFFAAHQIKTPLLMIHGEDDNNSGTFPMQSERLYQAVKGLGGTVRLVMLPLESHGYRARESILHMMWETTAWLDEFVKNAEPAQ